jgi:hypothetical protein
MARVLGVIKGVAQGVASSVGGEDADFGVRRLSCTLPSEQVLSLMIWFIRNEPRRNWRAQHIPQLLIDFFWSHLPLVNPLIDILEFSGFNPG